MPRLTFSSITLEDLKFVIHLQEGTVGHYDWNEVTPIALTDQVEAETLLRYLRLA